MKFAKLVKKSYLAIHAISPFKRESAHVVAAAIRKTVMSMTRGKDPKIRVYKGKEQSDTTTNHRSLPSVNNI